jgi:hypothetical protein
MEGMIMPRKSALHLWQVYYIIKQYYCFWKADSEWVREEKTVYKDNLRAGCSQYKEPG